MDDNELQKSFDARDWAKAFCKTAEALGHPGLNEAWVTTWFANALMRGWDEYHWRKVNVAEINDFLEGVKLEALHQRERWGSAHDREKSAEHWYWLVGYLAGKSLRASITGDSEKAKHHTISSAAALLHWHDAISKDTTGAGIGRDADLKAHDDGRQAHETQLVERAE